MTFIQWCLAELDRGMSFSLVVNELAVFLTLDWLKNTNDATAYLASGNDDVH